MATDHDQIPAWKINALFRALPPRKSLWREERRERPRAPGEDWVWADTQPNEPIEFGRRHQRPLPATPTA